MPAVRVFVGADAEYRADVEPGAALGLVWHLPVARTVATGQSLRTAGFAQALLESLPLGVTTPAHTEGVAERPEHLLDVVI